MGTCTYTEAQNQLPEGESKFPSLGVPETIALILIKLLVKKKSTTHTDLTNI